MLANTIFGLTPVTILNGQSLSPGVNLNGATLVGIQLPAAWTAAGITFQVSVDGGATYQDLYDMAGAEVALTVVAAHYVAIEGASKFSGFQWIKVRSGTGGTPVTQGADRALVLATQDF